MERYSFNNIFLISHNFQSRDILSQSLYLDHHYWVMQNIFHLFDNQKYPSLSICIMRDCIKLFFYSTSLPKDIQKVWKLMTGNVFSPLYHWIQMSKLSSEVSSICGHIFLPFLFCHFIPFFPMKRLQTYEKRGKKKEYRTNLKCYSNSFQEEKEQGKSSCEKKP